MDMGTDRAQPLGELSLVAMPTLQELRYFCAIYENGSFSAAARELHMSQPPLSLAIRALESRWGVQLFSRSTRSVHPLGAADALYPEALDILRRVGALPARVRKAAVGEVGMPVRLGAVTSTFTSLIPELIKSATKLDLTVTDLSSSRIAEQVVAGRLDAGLVRQTTGEHVDGITVVDEQLFAAAVEGHELAASDSCTLVQVAAHPMVVFDRLLAPVAYDAIMTGFRLADVAVTPIAHVSSEHAALGLVRAGIGVTVVPEIATLGPAEGISFIPIKDSRISYPLRLIVAEGDPRRLLPRLTPIVREAYRALRQPSPSMAPLKENHHD